MSNQLLAILSVGDDDSLVPMRSETDVEPSQYREALLEVLLDALRCRADADVLAAFEGGSAATGRLDRYSDVDLYIVAEATRFDSLFETIEAALQTFTSIAHVWPVAPPPWPGFAQKIYLVDGAPQYFMLDCCVLQRQTAQLFLQPERHGEARVLHDPQQLLRAAPFDRPAWSERLRARHSQIGAAFPIYRLLVEKEVERGHTLDAVAFYQVILRLFIELAGIVYRPERYDYGWRYLHSDLPLALQQDLVRWALPASVDSIRFALDEVSTRISALLALASAQATEPGNE